MTMRKKSLIIFAALALLIGATAQFLAADNSIIKSYTQNAQLIDVSTNLNTANQLNFAGSQLIGTNDYYLEMSLVVIALFSIIVSVLLKQSIDNKLFVFQRNDHIDV